MSNEVLIVSNILLWLAVAVGAVVMLGIARQVGLLHERSAPLGAMMTDHGPDIGDKAPTFDVVDYGGRPMRIGGAEASGRNTLLMFTGPTCPICDKLLPIIQSVGRAEKANVILISDGAKEEHERFLAKHPLEGLPYIVSSEIGMRFQVGKIPYGVLLDGDGVIRGKGLCNTREHIESLFEAGKTGHHSLQHYMSGKQPHSHAHKQTA